MPKKVSTPTTKTTESKPANNVQTEVNFGIDPKKLSPYQSHKVVRAIKLKEVTDRGEYYTLTPVDNRIGSFDMPKDYPYKGTTNDAGYFVYYSDSYQSWSPTEAFEKGYTIIR